MALRAVLSMADKKPHEKSDGTVVFCIGDAMSKKTGNYASFQKFLVKKVRELGYPVFFENEHNTSQKFPGTGEQVEPSGSNKIRIKYNKRLNIHIHREYVSPSL